MTADPKYMARCVQNVDGVCDVGDRAGWYIQGSLGYCNDYKGVIYNSVMFAQTTDMMSAAAM